MPRRYVKRLGSRSYANYSTERLKICIDAVNSGMPKTTASQTYGIPLRTLRNKMKGIHSKKPGGQTLFLPNEEEAFVRHIIKLAEFGFPITSDDLKHVVSNYLNKKGRVVSQFKDNVPGKEWVRLFVERHTQLSNRFASNMKSARVNITCQDILKYVDNLKKTIEGVPPTNIWNFDETSLSDDPKSKKVLIKRGVKYPERICNFSKSAFSLMFCVNAAGGFVPPYVVYKAEHLWSSWFEGGPVGCRYNRTKHGWFDANTFEDWFTSHMLPVLKKQEGPKVLIGDNLSSHINENVISLCEANNIRFVCLPPNTTHLTQPLDVSVFSSLKNEWRKLLSDWRETPEGLSFQTLPKDVFARLLSLLMDKMKPKFKEIVPPGFRKCSIFPIDCNEILKRLPPDATTSTGTSDSTCSSVYSLSIDVGDAFIEHLQRRRDELIRKPRAQRKKLNVPPGKSICPKDIEGSSSDVDSECSVAETSNSSSNASDKEQEETAEVLEDPINAAREYCVGEFVIVKYNEGNFPGQIVNISLEGLEVRCMEKGRKAWKWPSKEDKLVYHWCDIVKKITVNETKRGFYNIPELDHFLH